MCVSSSELLAWLNSIPTLVSLKVKWVPILFCQLRTILLRTETKLMSPSVKKKHVNEKIKQICFPCCLNVLSILISWSCALWELPAANWFFSAYQKRMHALIAASLYTGSLRCTSVGLQSTVCQQGWPWGSRNVRNNWLKGRVYTQVVQLPVHSTITKMTIPPSGMKSSFFAAS